MKKTLVIFLLISVLLCVLCTGAIIVIVIFFNPSAIIVPKLPNPNTSVSTTPSQPKPTVTILSSEFKITAGNLLISNDKGKSYKIAVKATDLEEEAEISSFEISPTKNAICFLVQTFGPQWLYYAEIENASLTNLKQVASGENCVWNHEGTKIAFTNSTSDVSPHNLYLFNTSTKKIQELTSYKYDDEFLRMYKEPSWSADDKYIYSNFTDYLIDDGGNMIIEKQGKSTVDWAKGKVSDYN